MSNTKNQLPLNKRIKKTKLESNNTLKRKASLFIKKKKNNNNTVKVYQLHVTALFCKPRFAV